MATFCDLVVTRWAARFRGRTYPCATGRGGIGAKLREGDGITPTGVWRLIAIYHRPGRAPAMGRPIRQDLSWGDDPDRPHYNRPFRHRRPGAETMFRADRLYDLVAVLDYNSAPVIPGAGSAIFLHAWRKPRHPTAGCIAFAPGHLHEILSLWTPRSRIIVGPTPAQAPEALPVQDSTQP